MIQIYPREENASNLRARRELIPGEYNARNELRETIEEWRDGARPRWGDQKSTIDRMTAACKVRPVSGREAESVETQLLRHEESDAESKDDHRNE